MDNFNFFKSILVTAPLPLLVACGKPTPRISRHTLPCNCEHIIDGKAQVLKIADYKTEMIFEYLISKLSLAPRNFILCYAKMKDNSGMARVFKNTNFVYIDPEDTPEAKDLGSELVNLNLERTYTLLHEIGHILNDHVSFQDQSIDRELELNTFVGNMFFQIGIPKQVAIESVSLRRLRTKTHPSGKEIREKLLEGYEQAERMDKLDIFTYLQSLNPEKYE